MLVLDTSDAASPALAHLRTAAAAFLGALPPDDEVLLATTGRQLRIRVQPTTDRKKLKDAAGGLFSDGAGTVLMDALMEIDDRFIKKALDVNGRSALAGAASPCTRWCSSRRTAPACPTSSPPT